MNRLIVLLITGVVVATASADLTTFTWAGGLSGDATAGQTVHTLLDNDDTPDWFAMVSAGEIHINDIQGLGFGLYDSQTVVIAPPFAGSTWGTTEIYGDGSVAGQYAYAVLANADTWANITEGDTIKFVSFMGLIEDLQPGGTGTPALSQVFNPGTVTEVLVVPEPATIMLLASGGGLTLFVNRRRRLRQA